MSATLDVTTVEDVREARVAQGSAVLPRRRLARPAGHCRNAIAVHDVSGLTVRGKILLALAWVALGLAVVVALLRPWEESGSRGATIAVRVESGDTLWQLAREADPLADTRESVTKIMEVNGLNSAGDLRVGDVLRVPVQG